MTAFLAGGERAIVSIGGGTDDYHHIYLARRAPLSNIAGVLLAVLPRVARGEFLAGEVAADFIGAVNPTIRCQLVSSASRLVSGFFPRADVRVAVSHDPDGGFQVSVFAIRDGGQVATPLFVGSPAGFSDWAARLTGLEDVVKKVVKFKYNGGSNPGAERLVRVEKVERVGSLVRLSGYDLTRDDLKMAFRRYTSDRIEGDIITVW